MKYEEPKMDVRILLKGKVVTTSSGNKENEGEGGSSDPDEWA